MKYIALLRGINVGGNNKVAMVDLKQCFEELGFESVQTYINSGNVLFETKETDKASLVKKCETALEVRFGFVVICAVITAQELHNAVARAPEWWGADTSVKHNAIFVIAPASTQDIMQQVGEARPEYEHVAACEPIIFWSAPVETFSRTRYIKIVGSKCYKSVTIRNAIPTKKLVELSKD